MLIRSLVIFFMLGTLGASAQNPRAFLSGSISGSQISGDNLAGYNQPGLNVGIGLRSGKWGKYRSGEVGLHFVQKGSRQASSKAAFRYRLRLNYLGLQAGHFWDWKDWRFGGGLQVSYLVHACEGDQNECYTFFRPFNTFDFSTFLMVTYRVKKNWDLFAYSDNSFIPVRKHLSGTSFRLNAGQYNAQLRFGARYFFGRTR